MGFLIRWLPLMPVILVPAALALWAEGKTAVPSNPWVSVACALGFSLWAGLGRWRRRKWDWLVLAVVAAGSGQLFFSEGFPRGHDTWSHLWGVWGFFKEILAGDLYPRWFHHIGLGMPVILVYPPIPFYLLLPFLAVGLPAYVAFKWGFVLYSILAAGSMYWVVVRATGSGRAALVAALAYVWAPYMLLDSHFRTTIGEATAFIFAPLFFDYGLRALRAPGRESFAKAVVAAALMVLSHPLSTGLCWVGIAVWISAEWWPFSAGLWVWLRKMGTCALIGAAAMSLAGFYLVPLFAEISYTGVGPAVQKTQRRYSLHGLQVGQLLEPRRWTEWVGSAATGSEADKQGREMPFYFGLGLLATMLLAWNPRVGSLSDGGKARRKDRATPSEPRCPIGLRVMTLAALLLTLRPLDQILGSLPGFSILEFPWRFLFVATVGAAWTAGYGALAFETKLRALPMGGFIARLAPGILGVLLILDGHPYTGAVSWNLGYEGLTYQVPRPSACGTRLHCWGTEPVRAEVPFRIEGMAYLPPTDNSLDLSVVGEPYPLSTAAVRWHYFRVRGKARLEILRELSVGLTWNRNGSRPWVLRGLAPYAQLRSGKDIVPLDYQRRGGRVRVELPGREGQVVVKEQYFPGWTVITAGGRKEVTPTPTGLLQAGVTADQRELVFTFSELRWDRLLGWILTCGTAAVLLWPSRWRRSRRSRTGTKPGGK